MSITPTFYILTSGIMFTMAAFCYLVPLPVNKMVKYQSVRHWLLLTIVLAGVVQYANYVQYQTQSLDVALICSRVLHHCANLLQLTMILVVTRITGRLGSSKSIWLLGGYVIFMALVDIFSTLPMRYASLPELKDITLAWGETISALDAPTSILGKLRDSMFLVIHAWMTAAMLLFVLTSKNKQLSRFFVFYALLVTILLANDYLTLTGRIDSIILSLSGIFCLILFFTFQFILEYVDLEAELRRQAYTDKITLVSNRAGIFNVLENLFQLGHNRQAMSLIVTDIDHFQVCNQAYGFLVGNQILKELAKRFADYAHLHQLYVARFDSDRFLLLASELLSSNKLLQIAHDLEQLLQKTIYIDKREIQLSCTIGMTQTRNADIHGPEDVFILAEKVILHAKKVAKSEITLLTDLELDDSNKQLEMKQQLELAIRQEQLDIVLQPQFHSDGQLYGAEVLVRWQHPTLGLVSPLEFIPLAERFGLISKLGHAVLNKTARYLAGVGTLLNASPFRISLNVSAWELNRASYVEELMHILSQHNLPPSLFTLEITETALVQDFEDSKRKLVELKQRGFRIALDDFGTGYSSLSYLRQLPLDILKIDKAFVDDVSSSSQQPMIEGIVKIADSVNLLTVAEGVENLDQLTTLGRIGIDVFQGYYLAKPMPFSDFVNAHIIPYAQSKMTSSSAGKSGQ